ncbi:TerC family protein [Pseudoteredinibacter isoporae]|uniref:Putative tellurium resistance membrane protein TerC n=1 Tax=Pseudoteredinibacter isoporae TaxID=570281 RepID=A0A7X0JTN5_9GAMM|nr:tellurium resistance protein TerC [Pseudoteredinibacter isoporae]MBB6522054.1 putative tellurium resistance membrane protein TerC [Pseudoteredinibacter isoporae]NHO87589.1 tellurium resistance protein TerC [Pseudoteredinibacter isoporae]NIB24080.1 tellurium resistance protein TerC [Pseudoteredinibacter isoporae]
MAELLSVENFANLAVLIFLQAVLGFDNLLYISIESQRAPAAQQAAVRRWGIIIAVALRVILLFVMIKLISSLTEPFFDIQWTGVIEGSFNFATIVFLFGGAFIMYTAVKEIFHLLSIDDLASEHSERTASSAMKVTAMIVFMNLIFSFDSILSALAITDVFAVLAVAILVSGAAMYLLADRVTEFIQKNRKYEVLGLFILLIVGVVLLGEGGHEAHLKLFGHAVEPMSKATFYFSVTVLVIVDVIQSKYRRKLEAQKQGVNP